MMKRSLLLLPVVLCFFVFASSGQTAQANGNSNIVKKDLAPAEIDRIIKKFTKKEGEFHEALKGYVFNRDATVWTVGIGGNSTGSYHRVSFMTINEDGSRFEKITAFPMPTLTEISITPEDLEDLGGVNPFALEPSALQEYNISYIGVEHIDELDLYVFDVTPKVIPDPKKSKQRLFTGRVWVDVDDLQIVKSKGKAVPETKQNKFPIVETWREQVDRKYWFPTFVEANDELVFNNGQVVHIRMKVKYADYRLGRSDVRILDDEPVKPTPTPTPKKPE
jgi:hypothetical protein